MTTLNTLTERERALADALGDTLQAFIDVAFDHGALLQAHGQDDSEIGNTMATTVERAAIVWEQVVGEPITMTRALIAAGFQPPGLVPAA